MSLLEQKKEILLGDCLELMKDIPNGIIDMILCDLDNIQFLTWFENRAKAEMSQQEWDIFKKKTNTKSDLFI